MDSGGGDGANNSRYRRQPPSSDRLLGIFSTAHSLSQPSTSNSASTSAAAGDELSEHDIFDTPSDAIHHFTPSTSTSPNANHHRSPNHRSHHKHFGILAALPESESHAQALLSVSSSSSCSSTSSARLIPTIPKRPPVDRVKYLQSAPVNVPIMSAAAADGRIGRHFDEVDDDDDDVDGGEMLPPHEFVASRQTPILAFSMVEGAGRKLKGRDLRQNTVASHSGMASFAVASIGASNAPENTVAAHSGMTSFAVVSFGANNATQNAVAAHSGMTSFAVASIGANNAPRNTASCAVATICANSTPQYTGAAHRGMSLRKLAKKVILRYSCQQRGTSNRCNFCHHHRNLVFLLFAGKMADIEKGRQKSIYCYTF